MRGHWLQSACGCALDEQILLVAAALFLFFFSYHPCPIVPWIIISRHVQAPMRAPSLVTSQGEEPPGFKNNGVSEY